MRQDGFSSNFRLYTTVAQARLANFDEIRLQSTQLWVYLGRCLVNVPNDSRNGHNVFQHRYQHIVLQSASNYRPETKTGFRKFGMIDKKGHDDGQSSREKISNLMGIKVICIAFWDSELGQIPVQCTTSIDHTLQANHDKKYRSSHRNYSYLACKRGQFWSTSTFSEYSSRMYPLLFTLLELVSFSTASEFKLVEFYISCVLKKSSV